MLYLALTALFVAYSVYREAQWARERSVLLQRIQAPEVAAVQHDAPVGPSPEAIGFDNDAEYWDRQELVR